MHGLQGRVGAAVERLVAEDDVAEQQEEQRGGEGGHAAVARQRPAADDQRAQAEHEQDVAQREGRRDQYGGTPPWAFSSIGTMITKAMSMPLPKSTATASSTKPRASALVVTARGNCSRPATISG